MTDKKFQLEIRSCNHRYIFVEIVTMCNDEITENYWNLPRNTIPLQEFLRLLKIYMLFHLPITFLKILFKLSKTKKIEGNHIDFPLIHLYLYRSSKTKLDSKKYSYSKQPVGDVFSSRLF